jgi:hypothetical protein
MRYAIILATLLSVGCNDTKPISSIQPYVDVLNKNTKEFYSVTVEFTHQDSLVIPNDQKLSIYVSGLGLVHPTSPEHLESILKAK